MMRLFRLLTLTAAIGAFAGAAQAQSQTPLIVKDGNSNSQSLCEYIFGGTLTGCTTHLTWNGTTFQIAPADTSGRPFVDVFQLPNVNVAAGGIVDGGIATLGTQGDTAYLGSGSATVNAVLKGIYNVQTQPIPTGPNTIGNVGGALRTTGGWTYKLLTALSTLTPATIKAGPTTGQLGMLQCYNPNSVQVYIQIYDSTAAVTGTTTPVLSIPIAPTSTGGFVFPMVGIQFNVGIQAAATTTPTGNAFTGTAGQPDCNAAFN